MMYSNVFDYDAVFEPLLSAIDFHAYQNIAHNTSEFQKKLQKIAFDAVEENTVITSSWAEEMIDQIDAVMVPQDDSVGYALGLTEFSNKQIRMNAGGVAGLIKVAQKAQRDTMQLLL